MSSSPQKSPFHGPQKNELVVGAAAEWFPAKMILMHKPGHETFFGVLHASAALYENPFDIADAAQEHQKYQDLLKANGVKVVELIDVLLEGTLDENGKRKNGPELRHLRAFAERFYTIDASELKDFGTQLEQPDYKRRTLEVLHPSQLIDIILAQPTVHLHDTERNTGFAASYETYPLFDMYFCRDQMITTKLGVVLGKFNSDQRRRETEIMKFALHKLGIRVLHEVTGAGRLEGGDFIPCGDTSFIGQGLRTNAEGVRQLLEHKVFGTKTVAVVKDSWCDQEEMHLDTYFNIIGPKLAVMVDLRLNLPSKPPAEGINSSVDVYVMDDASRTYELKRSNVNFQLYLEELGFTVIPVTRDDQLRYGINFLTIADGLILGIDGVSAEYKAEIAKHGVKATWMEFKALCCGYGAAHCTTQTLIRSEAAMAPL